LKGEKWQKMMNIFKKLKSLGDVEIPLTLVVVVVAITVIMVYQPQKEVHYVFVGHQSQKIHSL
jgi:hypothetical protein